jgi:hypothetical protein
MPLQNISNINIGLATTGVTQQGFAVPIFIGAHRHFPERVRSYTSLEGAASDIPADSAEYQAVLGFLSATSLAITPIEVGEVYSFTITVNDGDEHDVTYTAQALDTAEDVVDAWIASIEGNAAIDAHVAVAKVGTGSSATLSIEPVGAEDVFSLSNISEVTATYTTAESAADVLSAVRQENDDFYSITAHDHTEAFVLAMAAEVEALNKIYFTSNGLANALATMADPPTDIPGKLTALDYFRTVVLWHQDADTKFPETYYLSRFVTKQPGTTDWSDKVLAGLGISRHPTTGQALTYTQKNNLWLRNANFIEAVAGNNIVRTGKVVADEWIDTITSRDLLEARINEAVLLKKINSEKIPYSNHGINAFKSVVESTASRYVETEQQPNILEERVPYRLNFPRRENAAPADVIAGVYTATGEFYLSGAIRVFTLNATLTYNFN